MKKAQFACTRNWKDCLMAYEAMWFVSWCGDTEREFLLKKEVLEHSSACGQLSGVLFEAENVNK